MIFGTSKEDIAHAAAVLQNGGLVAIPTETVYGLAASALDPVAVAGIFKAKGRPADNPLIVHIAEKSDLDKYAVPSPLALRLAEAFWPGPLTMILPKKSVIPAIVSAGLDTVAIRCPSHPVAREIIRASGLPLAAPSANKSGKPSATKASHVEEDYEGRIDVIDAGECACGVESTVISLVNDPPVLLRPGFITPAMLRTYIPDLRVADAVLHELPDSEKALSPGLKHRHYAPDADTVCVSGPTEDAVRYIGLATPSTMRSCVICFEEEKDLFDTDVLPYGHEHDEAELASRVFDCLREADSRHYDRIYVRTRLSDGVGLAVYNRLLRACGFHVVHAEDTPVIIGVTGRSGAGKSVFGETASKYGYQAIDADKVYSDILPTLIPSLMNEFGASIVNNGDLDRRALAAAVFTDPHKKERLEALTHPAVIDEIKRRVLSGSSRRYTVEAIGLIETGFARLCSKTVTVYTDDDTASRRIETRDGLDGQAARRRLHAQKPTEFYLSHTDAAFCNDGDRAALEEKIKTFLITVQQEETT